MIFNLQAMAIGGVAIAAVAGGLGVKAGSDLAKVHEVKAIEQVKKTANGLINTLQAERDNARAEVKKFNDASAAQVTATLAAADADKTKRDQASARMEKVLLQVSVDARAAAERADAAREVIKNVADQCARAGVPPDVLSVLNTILDPPKAGVRDGAMPAARGPDRP